MLKEQRWDDILTIVQKNGFITIKDLSNNLNVSEMTIRRDVNYLAKENKVEKLRGGIKVLDESFPELSTQEKIIKNIDEKKYIGTIINSLIKDGDTVFLGPGTTILYGLEYIDKEDLTIVTNSLLVLLEMKKKYRCILTGGEFFDKTEEFIGDIANRAFDNLNINISFIATNGVYNNNITTSKQFEGNVQNCAIDHSQINCLVLDSSKFNNADIYTFNTLSNLDYLITDWKISEEDFEKYSRFTTIVKEN